MKARSKAYVAGGSRLPSLYDAHAEAYSPAQSKAPIEPQQDQSDHAKCRTAQPRLQGAQPSTRGMTVADVTTEQARKIHDAIGPAVGFLIRLERRLVELGFPPSDDLYQKVQAATDAMQRLSVETHYLSCETGVGRSPRKSSSSSDDAVSEGRTSQTDVSNPPASSTGPAAHATGSDSPLTPGNGWSGLFDTGCV